MPEKELPLVLRFLIRLFQNIIYWIIQIPLIPFVVLAFIVPTYKVFVLSRKLGVDWTAEKSLQCRWYMHMFKTREDEASVQLYKALPVAYHTSLLVFAGAALIANRICGYHYSLAEVPEPAEASFMLMGNCRAVSHDRNMERNIDQVEQVVIMGAGYDLRVLKYAGGKNIKVFELDKPAIQNMKIAALKKAKIDHDLITYVPIDFNNESWSDKLLKYGFDTKKKTFFLWEGVTPLISEEIVRHTLHTITSISPKGSVISLDYFSKSIVTGEGNWVMKQFIKLLRKTGEELLFGIDTSGDACEETEKLLKECGFTLKNLTLFGKKTKKDNPFLGVVEAVIE